MNARFLHVTPIEPLPQGNGLAMRTSIFAQALAMTGTVEILVVGDEPPVPRHDSVAGKRVSHLSTRHRHDTKMSLIGAISDPPSKAAALCQSGRPFATRAISAPVISDFARLLDGGSWKGIVVSRAHLLPLFTGLPQWPQLPIIVDLDDDDADLARQRAKIARQDSDPGGAEWMEAEADTFENLIGEAARHVRLFTAASRDAAASLSGRIGCEWLKVVPNGVEMPAIDRAHAASGTLLFVGNLSYGPNIDGLRWFIDEVWGRLRALRPNSRLIVAGSRPDASVRQLCDVPGISLVADPASLDPLYGKAAAAIVPLRIGSGSRIKILEAGAYGVPVVSTHEGAAGLELDTNRHFFASSAEPSAFCNTCIECLDNRGLASSRALELREFVRGRHDRKNIIAELARMMSDAFAA